MCDIAGHVGLLPLTGETAQGPECTVPFISHSTCYVATSTNTGPCPPDQRLLLLPSVLCIFAVWVTGTV